MHCPSDIVTEVELGSGGAHVNWTEPYATDESGNTSLIAKTHHPGELYGVGRTMVTYIFMDSSNNIATCTFQIMGESGELPQLYIRKEN